MLPKVDTSIKYWFVIADPDHWNWTTSQKINTV
ncbi:MAG: hypothetical protein ACJAX4_001769 [Clostridium sp.]|jgi:hypothetical protein